MKYRTKAPSGLTVTTLMAAFLIFPAAAWTQEPFDALPEATQSALIACELDASETNTLLALNPQQFDQDFSGGWRPVGDQGCHEAAAGLILAYIDHTDYTLSEAHIRLMRWHAGQMIANSGDYTAAIDLLDDTFAPESDDPTWNLYVEATLAFLRRDREALVAARDELAATPVSEEEQAARRQFLRDNPRIRMPRGFVTEPNNLPVVNRLIECFESDYETAYMGNCD